MSSTFKQYVSDYMKSEWRRCPEYDRVYGKTSCEQEYCFVITKGFWYAVWFFTDQEHRDKPDICIYEDITRNTTNYGTDLLHYGQHRTNDGVYAYINARKAEFSRGNYKGIKGLPRIIIRIMPKDTASNPDKYLKPGDHIQSNWHGFSHEAIYIGKGKVIHMSGHGGTKSEGCAREGDLVPHFVSSSDAEIRIVTYCLRVKKPDEIVKTAKEYSECKFREGQYNLALRNCQHFASLCACGEEISTELILLELDQIRRQPI